VGEDAPQGPAPRELVELQDLVGRLLRALEGLAFVSRHFHPPQFAEVLAAVGEPDEGLAAARGALDTWPDGLAALREPLAAAADMAIQAFRELRAAEELGEVFRALRGLSRAQEALWPLAAVLPPVSRWFLPPGRRADEALAERLASPHPDSGLFHFDHDAAARGGCSVFVPEDYAPDRDWPLVVALHGGSGNGRAFIWSWVAPARAAGAIVLAPTAVGRTWALMDEDVDTPNLLRRLEMVRSRWRIDPNRLLLGGMSDGGTFSYVSGLDAASPFTHLAPVAAAFHPVLAMMADRGRLAGLPIHITHGALDWMFSVETAREAKAALERAGARVTFRELDDLSHTWPREIGPDLLAWLAATPARGSSPA
jgi:phospholipase/carboxylesterase